MSLGMRLVAVTMAVMHNTPFSVHCHCHHLHVHGDVLCNLLVSDKGD